MFKAFHDHKYETLDHVSTFADGIAVKTPGENTYELINKYVDDIVTVSEDEIATAILTLIEKHCRRCRRNSGSSSLVRQTAD